MLGVWIPAEPFDESIPGEHEFQDVLEPEHVFVQSLLRVGESLPGEAGHY